LLVVVAIAVAIAAAARSPSAAGWTTVATFKGDGGHAFDTKPFAVHGRNIRVVYTVEPNSSGPVPLLWSVFREGTSGVQNELGRHACVSCNGKQTDEVGAFAAGSYYLRVLTSRPWTMTVEEAQ